MFSSMPFCSLDDLRVFLQTAQALLGTEESTTFRPQIEKVEPRTGPLSSELETLAATSGSLSDKALA